jgi:hypothetical protein
LNKTVDLCGYDFDCSCLCRLRGYDFLYILVACVEKKKYIENVSSKKKKPTKPPIGKY